MVITTAELIVNQYFDKKRALAYGIVFSGSGIGYFVSAPILSYVLDKQGLEATFLVEAAVTSVCVLLGLLLKNPTDKNPNFLVQKEKINKLNFFNRISALKLFPEN